MDSWLRNLRGQVWLWVKDLVDVLVTVGVLIVVFRLLLGSQTLVPLVVVTSSSMVHDDDSWYIWLSTHNMSNDTLDAFPFQNGFRMGDMIVIYSPDKYHLIPETKLGDVVIYKRDKKYVHVTTSTEPIIHRVVGVVHVEGWQAVNYTGTLDCFSMKDFTEHVRHVRDCAEEGGECLYPKYPANGTFRFFITKGDNNPGTDQCAFSGGIALPVNQEQLIARGWIRLPYIGWIKLVFNLILRLLFFWL